MAPTGAIARTSGLVAPSEHRLSQPGRVLERLHRVVSQSVALKSARGEASEVVAPLLKRWSVKELVPAADDGNERRG